MFVLGFALALVFPFQAPASSPPKANAARATRSVLVLEETPALTLELRSPRVEASELTRMLQDDQLRAALNERHLADCGTLRASRPFVLENEQFAAGDYGFGIEIDGRGAIALRLSREDGKWKIPLEASEPSSPKNAVPQVTVSFLAQQDLESFRLEVRFGPHVATGALDLSLPRIIVGLNNTAHALLSKSDRDARDVVKALYFAGQASKMTSDKNPLILDTYAMALFHAGQIESAIVTQTRAIEMLEPGQEKHRASMRERLAAYRGAKN